MRTAYFATTQRQDAPVLSARDEDSTYKEGQLILHTEVFFYFRPSSLACKSIRLTLLYFGHSFPQPVFHRLSTTSPPLLPCSIMRVTSILASSAALLSAFVQVRCHISREHMLDRRVSLLERLRLTT